MEEITVTQNGFDGRYASYLYEKVRERFSFLPAEFDFVQKGGCSELAVKTEREYSPYVRKFTEEMIADILTIGYKYAFFEKRLPLPLLDKKKKRFLLTALVSADYKEDRGYALRKIRGYESYCLDGFFYFRLGELKARWEGIVDYIPTDMGETNTDSFLGFLADDGEGKIFVKNGKVYNEEYRPLTRSVLTGEPSVIGEILLGGAERVYCFGEVEQETKNFLKKYYGEKAVFC